MLKNHFIVALRNLIKQKFYTSINIIGLAVGLCAVLLIGLFIQHELSYDTFHEEANNIVKANLVYGQNNQDEEVIAVSPDILLSTFQQEFPEVISGVRVFNPSGFRPTVVKVNNELYQEKEFIYADSTFFQVFTFPLLKGSADQVLDKAGSVVLSSTSASKYFPSRDPIGGEIEVSGLTFIVTGIMADPPDNSSLQPSMVASFSSYPGSRRNTWGSANYWTYFLLDRDADLDHLQAKVQPYMQRMGLSNPSQGSFMNFNLIPLTQLHLYSAADSTSDIRYVLIFSAIALLILVIAGINYMNLATARSTSRAKEVGVRKSVGAFRLQLVMQFLVEAVAISMLALVLALLTTLLLLPVFNELTAKNFVYEDILNVKTLVASLSVSLFIGLLAGIYPALVLSMFKPSQVLKGEFKSSSKGSWLRQSLVVFQFGISVFLIISTLVVGSQLQHVQSVKLGYDREHVLVIPINRNVVDRMEVFKNEVIAATDATHISIVGESPANIRGGYGLWTEGMEEGTTINVTAVAIDNDYIPTLQMSLIAGENLTTADRKLAEEGDYHFILNETALAELALTLEEAVGSRVLMNGRAGVIKGIVNDFHFRPLHQKIAPLVLFPEKYWSYNFAMVRMADVNPSVMASLQHKWIEMAPETPFTYDFLDDTYNYLYQSEARLAKIFGIFSTIGIIIASLGLVGLVSFTTVQRSKEIGIRKVLGASIQSVLTLVVSDFGKLVVIAFLLAAPLAYYVMTSWLQSFEYRITIGAAPILGAFAIALGIAIFSISYQVIRAATADPIKVLKEQ